MKNIELVLSVAATALTLLITVITFVRKLAASEKTKCVAESMLKISSVVLAFVKEAETFINFSGEEKKNYVISKSNSFAKKNGIPFDVDFVDKKIEELIALTKDVNNNSKSDSG